VVGEVDHDAFGVHAERGGDQFGIGPHTPQRSADTPEGRLSQAPAGIPQDQHVRAPDGWTKTFTDPRLCAAIVDRLTFAGQIIETGTTSYRLAHARKPRRA
jgi:hypothetical protein